MEPNPYQSPTEISTPLEKASGNVPLKLLKWSLYYSLFFGPIGSLLLHLDPSGQYSTFDHCLMFAVFLASFLVPLCVFLLRHGSAGVEASPIRFGIVTVVLFAYLIANVPILIER